jgi:C_GCAxxG_C_C family probable redox protein
MDKKQIALDAMSKKFNCAQSVFAALSDDVGADRETALKTAACFGGGIRCGEVCGAVTGALMALGMKYGSCMDDDLVGKQFVGQKTLEYIKKFKEKHGTILCRELLKYDTGKPDEMKKAIQKGHATVCTKAVCDAVEIVEEMIIAVP